MNRNSKTTAVTLSLLAMMFTSPLAALSAQMEYLQAKPLEASTVLRPVRTDKLLIPTLTWAGDISTIYAFQTGVFQQEGLNNVELFKNDDIQQQVSDCISGKTPYLRGTMGMINCSAEAFKKAGTDLVVIYQLTWSSGGDTMVVRSNINSLTDLNGKNIAVQRYGPHTDFAPTLVRKAGLSLDQVHLKWLKNLDNTTGVPRNDDPVSAFQQDRSIDATMVIAPDAATLTQGGGAEGSVRGAKILFTSAAANRIIADVYAVRKDYYDAHRAEVQKFVHALMVGQERFDSMMASNNRDNRQDFKELMRRTAKMQFGDVNPDLVKQAKDSLGDCTWVGFNGNVGFFTGKNQSRNFNVLTKEIQSEFKDLGFMRGAVPLSSANWDYQQLAAGLKNADMNAMPKPLLTERQAQAVVAKATMAIAAEPTKWEQDGSLYSFEIHFDPNMASFPAEQYKQYFQHAYEISQPLGGAVVYVEGHVAPDNINKLADKISKAKASRADESQVAQLTSELGVQERFADNLAMKRARSVVAAYLQYCAQNHLYVDKSQFQPISLAASASKYPHPQTEAEFLQNFRVVFRIKQVEIEPTKFQGAN